MQLKLKKAAICIGTALCLFMSAAAKTIQVQHPGNDKDIQPNIQAAINKAVNGDTVFIPAGNFIFNNKITVTKFISLKGAGMKTTILYRAESTPDATLDKWGSMFHFNTNSRISSNISISAITFKSKKPSKTEKDALSKAKDKGIEFTKTVDFRVWNCRFENFGIAAISVTHDDDLARGLICKNEFYHNAKGFDGLGYGYGIVIYGADMKWIDDPKFGSANFIFIEDNVFDFHRHAIAAGGAALFVARYNTITNNIISQYTTTHAIDGHEARGGKPGNGNYHSTRAFEAYNNTIINNVFHDGTPKVPGKSIDKLIERGIAIRGGEALVHNNVINGYRFGIAIDLVDTPWGTAYPLPYSPGYLSGKALGSGHSGTSQPQGNGDVFVWSNRFTPYITSNADGYPLSTTFANYNNGYYSPAYFKEGRDYHLVAKPGYKPYPYPHPLHCSTDLNKDGVTDNDDFLQFIPLFGSTSCQPLPFCPTDLNTDGVTDINDFMKFQLSFNQKCL